VVGALEGLEKLIRLMENYYDLLTGLDKMATLSDMLARALKRPRAARKSEGGPMSPCRRVRFSLPR
jgi:hypothetical protein